jgi:hypothetical protein
MMAHMANLSSVLVPAKRFYQQQESSHGISRQQFQDRVHGAAASGSEIKASDFCHGACSPRDVATAHLQPVTALEEINTPYPDWCSSGWLDVYRCDRDVGILRLCASPIWQRIEQSHLR